MIGVKRVGSKALKREPDDRTDLQGPLDRPLFEIDRPVGQNFSQAAFAFGQVNAVDRIDRVFQRHGLGVLHVGRLALVQVFVIFVIHFLGAFRRTVPAGDTLVHIDITGLLDDLDGKIALVALNGFDFRTCHQLDIDMPADLDQFRGDDSHGAVIGREGLVQLDMTPPMAADFSTR
jgi:hypothetical protein